MLNTNTEAMMAEVVVVGAGPAGVSAVILLRRQGVDVALVECE